MSSSAIVHLDSYRERRKARLGLTLALHAHDPEREQILRHLGEALSLVGADRGAVLWMDEYGPGLVHAYALLDLASDRPRRLFSTSPLRGAWDAGVPGLLDCPDAKGGGGDGEEDSRSLCAVALGSDGPRSWFLYLDSRTPRSALSPAMTGDLMFLAGECASIVLHRDLDEVGKPGSPSENPSLRAEAADHFAGWPVLRDIEDREKDDPVSRRIATRFLVARMVRSLVEDDLVADPDSLAYQVNGVRQEIASLEEDEPEKVLWERVVAAVEVMNQDELLAALLEWGVAVEFQGHLSGAREIHALAHELAVAAASPAGAVDAARFLGRVGRKRAEWDEASRWYGVAGKVAEETGDHRRLATVLDGQANTLRDRGNLPAARKLLHRVLALGEAKNDRYARAIGHHDLMTVEKLGENLEEAVVHGWKATEAYESAGESLRALFDLAGVFREAGDLAAARDAYTVVEQQVPSRDYRVLSLDALAYIAALEGRAGDHDDLRARVEEELRDDPAAMVRAQVLYFGGLSNLALGRRREARSNLEDALAFAEGHGLSKLIFDAEAALEEMESSGTAAKSREPSPPPEEPGEEVERIRRELRGMREALAGVEA